MARPVNITSALDREGLVEELHDLLDLRKPVLGRKIIQAVMNSMTQALLRGESVAIKGFGTFLVRELPSCWSGRDIIFSGPNGTNVVLSPITVRRPPRKVVRFRPSLGLLASINLEPPNVLSARHRRAMRKWKPNVDK